MEESKDLNIGDSAASKLISRISTLLIITLMVFAAERLGEKEIIFPEIAAISAGCFLAPKMPWRVNFKRMIAFITICAALGLLIVRFVPFSLKLQVILAYVVGQLIYLYSGTGFAPMISAIVLPVLIQTKTPVYLAAAVLLTVLITGLRRVLELGKIKPDETTDFVPYPAPDADKVNQMIFRSIYAAILISLALDMNARFIAAPPMLVAFTELTNSVHPANKRKPVVVALVSLCALAGALSRLAVAVTLQLPLTVAAAVACVAFMLLMDAFQMHFPPAGAMAILAMLIPQEALTLYPVYTLIGITLLVLGAGSYSSIPEAVLRRKSGGST